MPANLPVNHDMFARYWSIGRDLFGKGHRATWGKLMLDRASADLRADVLALERQFERMQRGGLDITSATLQDQLVALYHLLLPTLLALHARLFTQPVIHADESPWRVMGKGTSARW